MSSQYYAAIYIPIGVQDVPAAAPSVPHRNCFTKHLWKELIILAFALVYLRKELISLMIWVFVFVHLWRRLLSLIPEGSNTCTYTLWCEAFLFCVCVCVLVLSCMCFVLPRSTISLCLWQIRQDNDKDVSGSTGVSLWHVLESRAVDSAFIPPSTLSRTQQSVDSELWGI